MQTETTRDAAVKPMFEVLGRTSATALTMTARPTALRVAPVNQTSVDNLIYDLAAVMNGEEPGSIEQPEFNAETMEKMRALINKMTKTLRC